MSDSGINVAADVVPLLRANWVANCCASSAITLVLFHHATTVPQEIQLIWGRKWTSVTLLFYANRWATFAWALMSGAVQLMQIPEALTCTAVAYTQEAVGLFLLLIWAAFSTFRVYALSGGSWCFALFVCGITLVPVGMNVYGDYFNNWYQVVSSPIQGGFCVENGIVTSSLLRLTVATRVCSIVSEVVVLLVTWLKAYSIWRDARRLNLRAPVATILLRDGTLYFVALLFVNALQFVASSTNQVLVFAETWSITPLSSIIVSHFLLNLRQAAQASTPEDDLNNQQFLAVPSQSQQESAPSRSSISLRFASFIDNMGNMLVHADSYDTDVDTWDVYDDASDDSSGVHQASRTDAQLEDDVLPDISIPNNSESVMAQVIQV